VNTYSVENRTRIYATRRGIYWRPEPFDEYYDCQLPAGVRTELLKEVPPPKSIALEKNLALTNLRYQTPPAIRRDQASTDFAQAQLKRPLTSVASPVRRRRIVSSDILGELEMVQEIKKAARRRKISQTALCGVGPGRITEDRW
jgi:hypothetical protein